MAISILNPKIAVFFGPRFPFFGRRHRHGPSGCGEHGHVDRWVLVCVCGHDVGHHRCGRLVVAAGMGRPTFGHHSAVCGRPDDRDWLELYHAGHHPPHPTVGRAHCLSIPLKKNHHRCDSRLDYRPQVRSHLVDSCTACSTACTRSQLCNALQHHDGPLSLQMIRGRSTPWLPRGVRKRVVTKSRLGGRSERRCTAPFCRVDHPTAAVGFGPQSCLSGLDWCHRLADVDQYVAAHSAHQYGTEFVILSSQQAFSGGWLGHWVDSCSPPSRQGCRCRGVFRIVMVGCGGRAREPMIKYWASHNQSAFALVM